VFLGRDLINIPANDLGTVELTEAIIALGEKYGARVSVISGEDLLVQNFPLIHAVGRASPRAPALVDLTWGDERHPKITLVGKGIVFDTGGLDLKPSAAMLLMKKDMGGSAATIATASMIMAAKLPVRLRLLVPTAENSVSGNAFRPGDVLPSRKGLSIEIGNTDAEGRLVLADALALADEEAPELIVSFATLTGAARVALGPDLPPIYATDTAIGAKLQAVGDVVGDPMWQMPLYPPYAKMLSSEIADINHVSQGGFAGSITAALFLARFVEKASYVHLDIYGWNPSARPGVPKGGEVHCARALFHYLEEKYRP
jgi:leucyl aminopeptidase